MSKKVFYIESPGQLINAMEAVYYFQQEWLLVIRFNGSPVNDKQLEKVLSFYLAQEEPVFRLGEIHKVESFTAFLRVFTLAIISNRFRDIYVGCHKSKYLKVYNYLGISLYLIDDGIASLAYINDLRNKERKYCRKSFLSLKKHQLFTCLPESELKGLGFQRHNFEYLKSKLNDTVSENLVYFFGAKYIEAGILSEGDYELLLTGVLNHFVGMNVVYLPHRGEASERLERYKKLGFYIYLPEYPSEMEMVIGKSKPSIVAGFYTAALYSTSLIVPDMEIVSFKFSKTIADNENHNLAYIYRFFSQFSNVIELTVK